MHRANEQRHLVLILALVLTGAVACQATTPSPSATIRSPSASPAPGTPAPTEPATPPPTPAPTATPALTPNATPPDLTGRWAGGTVFPATPESVMTDVVALADRVVGIGLWNIGGAGTWVSGDGVEWRPIESETFAGLGVAAMTALRGGLVGVGRQLDPERDVAVVVRSPDARTWTRDPATPALEGAQMIDVVGWGDGLVATGSAPGIDAAALWFAADGTTWERIPNGPILDGAFIWAVASTGSTLIAGGWRREGGVGAAIWTSRTGQTWSLAPPLEGGDGMQIRGIAATARGLVAVGELIEGGRAAAWTSVDGGTWTLVDDPTFAGASMTAVAATPLGVVAVGTHNVDDAAIWLSTDGTEWTLVDDPDLADAFLTAVTAYGGRLVAVGGTQIRIGDTGSYDIRAGAWSAAP